ncbi:MAG: phosphopantetheine-binding protein [Solirubrobacterales bacterium]
MPETALSTEVLSQVIAAIVEVSPDTESMGLEMSTSFESIDVDSLDLVEIAQIVGDEHNIKFGGEALEGLRTIGDAVEFIVSKAS